MRPEPSPAFRNGQAALTDWTVAVLLCRGRAACRGSYSSAIGRSSRAMQACRRRTGEHQILAERTGIAQGTLEVIGSKVGYNATVGTLEQICRALDVTFGDLLEMIDDRPKPKAKRKKLRRRSHNE